MRSGRSARAAIDYGMACRRASPSKVMHNRHAVGVGGRLFAFTASGHQRLSFAARRPASAFAALSSSGGLISARPLSRSHFPIADCPSCRPRGAGDLSRRSPADREHSPHHEPIIPGCALVSTKPLPMQRDRRQCRRLRRSSDASLQCRERNFRSSRRLRRPFRDFWRGAVLRGRGPAY